MPEIKNTFLKGKMNKDVDERLLSPGEYRDALNIQIATSESNNAGSLHNVLGNEKLSTLNITGAICIGSIADTENNKLYWFIYGNNVDAIAEYDETTSIVSPVLVDNTKTIINFPNSKITAINIVEGYLAWTDDNSEPKIIDIDFFKNTSVDFETTTVIYDDILGGYRNILESDITVIKKKPCSAPIITPDIYGDSVSGEAAQYAWYITNAEAEGDTSSTIACGGSAVAGPLYTAEPELDNGVVVYTDENLTLAFDGDPDAGFGRWYGLGSVYDEVDYAFEISGTGILSNKVLCDPTPTVYTPSGLVTATGDFTGVSPGDITTVTFSVDPNFKRNQVFHIVGSGGAPVFICVFISIAGSTATIKFVGQEVSGSLVFSNYSVTIGDAMFEDKFVRFAYRWKFKNNQYSVISPFSEIAFQPYSVVNYDFEQGYNLSMENQIKSILIDNINVEDTNIASVDILYKESNNANIYIYKNIKKEDLTGFGTGTDPNICSAIIAGESAYNILPESQLLRNYDNVPYRSKAMEISSNRLIFGNYIDGLNVTLNGDLEYIQYTPTFNVSLVNRVAPEQNKIKSIKSHRTYQLGIVFEDEYGRQTTVYSNDSGIIENNFTRIDSTEYGKAILVSMDSLPSGINFDSRIKKFKYFIKAGNNDYYNIVSKEIYTDTENLSALWLVVPSYEINKVSEGDYLIFKRGMTSSDPINDPSAKYKILDLKQSKPDTLNSTLNFNDKFFIKVNASSLLTSNFTNVSTDDPAVFETLPKANILDIYYETENCYDINDYGNSHILKWFNCFDFGDGVESNRIRDDFNEALIDSQVRVSTIVEDGFKEKRNNSGLIFSGIFNSRNGINRLNEFNTGEAITKELNVEYGSIQKLHGRDSDIIAFTEDKVVKILANKDALYNADGNVNLTSTRAVLGTAVPFAGEFGISKNPESFANYGYQCYFADKARNVVLRLSIDGLTVISAYGISDYIRDIFNSNITNIIGGYDIHTKQYILSLGDTYNSIAYKEGIDGWTSRLSFSPENSIYLNGYFYTFKNGELWLHHSESANRNTFYGTKYNSTVKFIYNDDPTSIKYFKTLNYEGTEGWKATSIETDQQSGKVLSFLPKEGKWFNNIKGIETTLSNLDPKEFSIQGLGYAGNFVVETTTTTTAAPTTTTTTTTTSTTTTTTSTTTTTTAAPTTTTTTATPTTTTTTLAEFTCGDAGFAVSDGTVGDPVSASVIAGTLNSVTPSTYQLGIVTYTANITVPAGYSNSGSTLTTCTDTANGTAAPTTTTTTTAAPTTTTTTVNPNEVAAILLQTDSTTCSDSNSTTYSNRIAILASESILVESGGVLKINNTLSGTALGLERNIYDSGGSYPYSSKTISTSPTTIGPSYGAWDGLVNSNSLSNPSGNKLFANVTVDGTVYFTICP